MSTGGDGGGGGGQPASLRALAAQLMVAALLLDPPVVVCPHLGRPGRRRQRWACQPEWLRCSKCAQSYYATPDVGEQVAESCAHECGLCGGNGMPVRLVESSSVVVVASLCVSCEPAIAAALAALSAAVDKVLGIHPN